MDPITSGINSFPALNGISGVGSSGAGALDGGPSGPAFGEVLSGFLEQVDQAQHRADQLVESLAVGEPVDVHQVMLALNESSNAMQMTLQVRGKVLEAYQDLMRMPL